MRLGTVLRLTPFVRLTGLSLVSLRREVAMKRVMCEACEGGDLTSEVSRRGVKQRLQPLS